MKSLVIGYGSIGSRHARILTDLGCEVTVVSKREIEGYPCFKTISDAIQIEKPEYVVIASKTSEHYHELTELAKLGFNGTVLVEKPIFHKPMELPDIGFSKLFVAYNLRFHPLMQRLYMILGSEEIISATVYAGQYLPEWRPHTDYRLNYSARKEDGGGVLRDLSHELDYVSWMFGRWQTLSAIGGHYSNLEIDSDDVYAILMASERCPIVSLQLNYLDRSMRRTILVNTRTRTISLDLVRGILSINNESEHCEIERDFTYRAQHQAILNNEKDYLCSAEEGLEVVQLISAIEQSAGSKRWIAR